MQVEQSISKMKERLPVVVGNNKFILSRVGTETLRIQCGECGRNFDFWHGLRGPTFLATLLQWSISCSVGHTTQIIEPDE